VQLALTVLVPILGVFLAIAVNSEQKAELLVAIAVGGVGFVVMFFLERFIDHTIDGLEKSLWTLPVGYAEARVLCQPRSYAPAWERNVQPLCGEWQRDAERRDSVMLTEFVATGPNVSHALDRSYLSLSKKR